MINKAKLTLIAAIAASSIALPAAALAQSAYTTGSAASRAAAGYPSPYGYGSGLYAYAPGHFTAPRPGSLSANSIFAFHQDVEFRSILVDGSSIQ